MPKRPKKNTDKCKENKEIRELKKTIKKLSSEKSSMKRAIARRDKELSKRELPEIEDFTPMEPEGVDENRMKCPDCGREAEIVPVGIFQFCKCEKCGFFKKIKKVEQLG